MSETPKASEPVCVCGHPITDHGRTGDRIDCRATVRTTPDGDEWCPCVNWPDSKGWWWWDYHEGTLVEASYFGEQLCLLGYSSVGNMSRQYFEAIFGAHRFVKLQEPSPFTPAEPKP